MAKMTTRSELAKYDLASVGKSVLNKQKSLYQQLTMNLLESMMNNTSGPAVGRRSVFSHRGNGPSVANKQHLMGPTWRRVCTAMYHPWFDDVDKSSHQKRLVVQYGYGYVDYE